MAKKNVSITEMEMIAMLWKCLWRNKYALEDNIMMLGEQVAKLEKCVESLNKASARRKK